ncbi:MAG: SurA N-terminal domain-containing protein [Gammaproteobacteria bacterium]
MQKIRNWTSGWVAGVILGVVIITFAVWGINFADLGSEPIVATVNGKDIKLRQFQQAYNNFREQMQKYTGKSLAPGEEKLLKNQTLDKLIRDEIVNQASIDHGLQISNATIRNTIRNIEIFSGEDGFDRSAYEIGVMQLGMTPAIFEHQLRLELMANQMQSAVTNSTFVSEKEAVWLTRISKQTRDLSYVILSADELKDSIEISDDEIEEYYGKNSRELSEPEQVKIAYLELSVEKLAEEIEAAEEDLLAYYDNNKDKYDVKEQRKVNVIDIKLSPEAEDKEVELANSKAEKIRALIASGISFTDIAEKHDDGLKPDMLVSEHGYLVRGVLPKEIDEVVFSINEGELSEVTRTDRGLHIFRVDGIKGGAKNTYENVKEVVEKDYKNSEAEYKYFDLADKLVTLAYEHADSLEVAAEEIDIEIQESNYFSRNNASGLFAEPKVLVASFDEEAIKSGQNSEAIELNNNHIVVLQVLEHLSAEKKPLEAVKEQITQILKSEQASKMQQEKGQKILEQLKQGSDLSHVAESHEFEWTQANAVTRDDVSVNRKILRTAFKLGKPAEKGFTFGGTEIGKKDYVVIAVSKIGYPDTLQDEDIDKTKETLLQSKANDEWSSMVDELVDKASTSIYSSNL